MKKIKSVLTSVLTEIQMIWMWIKNLFFVFLTTKSEPHVFEGYAHFWFSQKYADKRTKISKINKYCGGKFHYVLPAGNYSLIVISSSEIQAARKRGLINKRMDISKVLESAYYVSTDKNKKYENK